MGELVNLSEYRKEKDSEIISLLREELSQEISYLTEEDLLFFSLLESGICPCCGQHMPEAPEG